jgi:hypothetical protein
MSEIQSITEKRQEHRWKRPAISLFLWLYTLSIAAWLVYLSSKLTCPVDGGDGLMHFFIAKGSWQDSLLWLDHWGKPLFTLVSSPFAQFGLQGMIWFNIAAFAGTCLIGFGLLKRLSVSIFLQLFFPVLLLLSRDYFANILSGLTEPFFGFLLVLSCYLLVARKTLFFAIIVSVLPFARSEGQLILVLAAGVLVFQKRWKYLPFLLTGHFIYACVGAFALADFWWYFNNNPYPEISIYGHGSWNHFWKHKVDYLGLYGFRAIALGLLGLLYVFMIDGSRRIRWSFIVFGGAAFLGIVLVHAYLWANGKAGSLGLTRVCTLGFPAVLLISLYLVQQFDIFRLWLVRIGALYLLIALAYPLHDTAYFYQQPPPMETCLLKAAAYVKKAKKPGANVYYHSPFFGLQVGDNPLTNTGSYHFYYFRDVQQQLAAMKKGDLIIRDSMFGPKEFGLPLDSLQHIPDWKLVQEYVPAISGKSYHGEPWNVKIYEKINDTP